MIMTVFMILLLIGIIRIGLRLAWGTAKFIFGLGLFWFCPLLFVIAAMFGLFSSLWLPILIIGLMFGRGFRKF